MQLKYGSITLLIICTWLASLSTLSLAQSGSPSQVDSINVLPGVVVEKAKPNFPSLLTLAKALSIANNTQHPDVLRQTAKVVKQMVPLERAQKGTYWEADLALIARTADLVNDDQSDFNNDSRARLTISKLLWDFGQSSALKESAELGVHGAQINADYAKRLQRINIFRRFFDVLSADHQFIADNEAMSLAFFPFNRAQDRRDRFDSVSQVEVLEKREAYLKEFTIRNQSIRNQRASRFRLALALGLPDAKPDNVIAPDLADYDRPVPDYDELVVKVLAAHPLLSRQQTQLSQIGAEQQDLDSRRRPKLKFKFEAFSYAQDYRTRDKTRAQIALGIPILTKNILQTDRLDLEARKIEAQAQLLTVEYDVREQVLSWVQTLDALNQEIEQNKQNIEFRERALDKSRLLYELEVKARIGQAQADMAKLIAKAAQDQYQRALIWEQIDAVLGLPPVEFTK